MQVGCDSLKVCYYHGSCLLWCFVIIFVVWGSFSVFFIYFFFLLLLFSFSLLCFYTALLFVFFFFFFLLPTVFVFPTWTKRPLNTGEIRIPHPRKSTGTIPTTTQNVPNKLYIRTSTFRFSSQLPGSPTVAAVGLSGYISMLQWTSQTPLPALLSVTTNSLWRNSKPSIFLLT